MGGDSGGKAHFVAVSRTRAVGGIGTHVVSGASSKSREGAGETASTAAVGGVVVSGSRSR